MENFTPISSALGGMLIGLSAGLILLYNGRIAGISGIVGGLLTNRHARELLWRVAFLLGLVVGGMAASSVAPDAFAFELDRSTPALVIAGLMVGFGTRLGNGCTSGHGVCGISRLSRRSIIATATFMSTGIVTVYIVNHILGGSL